MSSFRRVHLKAFSLLLCLFLTLGACKSDQPQTPTPSYCGNTEASTDSPGIFISVKRETNECIGLSEGNAAFDLTTKNENGIDEDRPDKENKMKAVNAYNESGPTEAVQYWKQAIGLDHTDAEPRIYLEDFTIAQQPHVTIVVAATLTGDNASSGRDTLQGAYVAQKTHNDKCNPSNSSSCIYISLLIANVGSSNVSPNAPFQQGYAKEVTQQILLWADHASQHHIVGIMDGLVSTSTVDMLSAFHDPKQWLPVVAATASSDDFASKAHFLRVAATDKDEATLAANFAKSTLHSKHIAVLSRDGDNFSADLMSDFEYELSKVSKNANYTVKFVGSFTPPKPNNSNTIDSLRKMLDAALNLNPAPDLIYCACFSNDVSVILSLLQQRSDHFASLKILGADAFYRPGDLSRALPKDKLSVLSQLYFTAFTYPDLYRILNPHIQPTDPPVPTITTYQSIFDQNDPQGLQLGTYGYGRITPTASVALDATQVLIQGGTQAYNMTPEQVESALRNVQLQGVSGQIHFDPSTYSADPINKSVVMVTLNDKVQFQYAGMRCGQFYQGETVQSCSSLENS